MQTLLNDRDRLMFELALDMSLVGIETKLPTTPGNFALVRRIGPSSWFFGTMRNGQAVWELPPLTNIRSILARLEAEKTGQPYEPFIEPDQLTLELEAA
jgi:hypothetical protein